MSIIILTTPTFLFLFSSLELSLETSSLGMKNYAQEVKLVFRFYFSSLLSSVRVTFLNVFKIALKVDPILKKFIFLYLCFYLYVYINLYQKFICDNIGE